jgi:uncharacterized membrane protein
MRFALSGLAILFVLGVIFAALLGVAIKILSWVVLAALVFAAGSWVVTKVTRASPRDARAIEDDKASRLYRQS